MLNYDSPFFFQYITYLLILSCKFNTRKFEYKYSNVLDNCSFCKKITKIY